MDSRRVLLRAMRAELNCWMWEFAHTTDRIANAVHTGRLAEGLLDAYPEGGDYPEPLSRGIAAQAGMDFDDASSEAVGLAVGNLRAVAGGHVSIHGDGFAFYEDNLALHGLTLDRVGQLMREHSGGTLRGAARLLFDAASVPIDEATSDHRPPLLGRVKGHHLDFRYRLWQAKHGVGYDDLRIPGGPALVPIDGWFKSTTVPYGWRPEHADVHDGKTELHVWRGERGRETHPIDGRRYDSSDAADRAAYKAGVTAFKVYETQAHLYPALNP